jgi:hypothetical protein
LPAQRASGDRNDPAHLVAALAAERIGELFDLAPGNLCQDPCVFRSETQLGSGGGRVGVEPISRCPVDRESRQSLLNLG